MILCSICFLQQYLLRKAELPKRQIDLKENLIQARAVRERHSMRLSSYRHLWLLSNQRARNLTSVVKMLYC